MSSKQKSICNPMTADPRDYFMHQARNYFKLGNDSAVWFYLVLWAVTT